jgi:hypothetical protein
MPRGRASGTRRTHSTSNTWTGWETGAPPLVAGGQAMKAVRRMDRGGLYGDGVVGDYDELRWE